MTTLTASKLRTRLADTLNRVAYGGERILLQRRGKDIAAIISTDDLELLEKLEEQADLRAVQTALKEPGTADWDEVKGKLGL